MTWTSATAPRSTASPGSCTRPSWTTSMTPTTLVPLRLAVPTRFQPELSGDRQPARAYRSSHTDVSDGVAATDVIDMTQPSGRAPQARHRCRQGPAGRRGDGSRRDRGSRLLGRQQHRQTAGRHDAGRGPVRVRRRRRDLRFGRRHADRHGRAGRQRRDPQRGVGQRCRVRPGARGPRGATDTAAVRLADQGRVDVGVRLPVGRAARRHRHRELDRHARSTPSPTAS